MSILSLCAGLAMVSASAWLIARMIGPPTVTGTLLGAYIVAFGEIVLIALSLSSVDLLYPASALLAAGLVLLGASFAWFRVRDRRERVTITAHLTVLRDPIVAALGTVVVAGLMYSAALMLATPPNDWDAMTYHLSRAAFWIQQHGIGYIPDSDVIRVNVNPPNAEIGSLFTMLLSGSDRFASLPQFTAALALGVGSAGIARRLGLNPREAVFGALAFLSLPTVLLQSSTALNDLVVASFLIAGAYFLLGDAKREFALGSAAVALAVGTKFTAYIALPLLAVVVLVGQLRDRWIRVTTAWVVGVLAGSYWLVVNVVNTGHLDGGAGAELEQHPDRSLPAVIARASRMGVNFADDLNLGRDLWLYPIGAGILVVVLVGLAARTRSRWITAAALIAAASVPLVLGHVRELLLRTHERVWIALGREDLAFMDPEREALSPSTVLSYFGPTGFVLLVTGVVLAIVATRGRTRRFAVVLGVSPLVLVGLVALALVYDPWRGRFLVFSLALAAASWGLALRFRWLAWSIASLSAVTVILSFVHALEKPAGVSLLGEGTSRGVWGEPREVVQSWLLDEETARLVAFFAREPESGRVGLDISEDDWVFPYFGRTLGRDVRFVEPSTTATGLDWIVTRRSPSAGWALALRTDALRVYRRDDARMPP